MTEGESNIRRRSLAWFREHYPNCAPPERTIGNGLNDEPASGDDQTIGPTSTTYNEENPRENYEH